MESVDGNGGSRLVVTELSHIKELVSQLEVHLVGSPDLCKNLAAQISSLTERSIGMIMSFNLDGGRKRSAADAGLTSPLSAATPSPLSDGADAPFKTNKKRKTTEKLRRQVRVRSTGGGANPVDDGHSWRKYGQKEILGAKNPRGYYRCTHRHSQGCAATKQVQRTDNDPTLFDVIYHGEHTCVNKVVATGEAAAAAQQPAHNPDAHNLLQSLSATLTVKTEGLAAAVEPQGWSTGTATPFCFSSTPASGGRLVPDRSPFSAPETPENWGVSPATSDSNHVAAFAPFASAGAGAAQCRAQSEFQEVVSALVAAASVPEPAADMDFADDYFNLDTSIDNLDQSILSYFADPYAADEQ